MDWCICCDEQKSQISNHILQTRMIHFITNKGPQQPVLSTTPSLPHGLYYQHSKISVISWMWHVLVHLVTFPAKHPYLECPFFFHVHLCLLSISQSGLYHLKQAPCSLSTSPHNLVYDFLLNFSKIFYSFYIYNIMSKLFIIWPSLTYPYEFLECRDYYSIKTL